MGTTTSPEVFLGKLSKAAEVMADPRPGLIAAGKTGKTIFTAGAAAAGVGRGIGKTKVSGRVSAAYDLKHSAVVIKYRGPVHLINNSTKPHPIGPRKRRRARGGGSGRGGIVIPGVGVRASAQHPGTRGKHFVEAAKRRSEHECPKAYMKAGISEPLKAVFS